jgi:hypothetical protein
MYTKLVYCSAKGSHLSTADLVRSNRGMGGKDHVFDALVRICLCTPLRVSRV